MKHFIIKICLLIILCCSVAIINYSINISISKNQKLPVKNKRILIVGDSHPEKSLDPSYFESAQNISQPGEPYVITYWKLKKFLDTYIPDTLMLGFAPHNISAFNDLKFSNKHWSEEMFRRCYTFENFNEIKSDLSIDYLCYYKILFKELCTKVNSNHIHYIGKYHNFKRSNINDWELAINRHYYLQNRKLGVSQIAINYLDSIIYLCNKKNIKPILFSSPVHDNYWKHIPSKILTVYNSIKEKYNKQIQIIDKTNDSYDNSMFLNADHLNQLGAKKFSLEIKQLLKEQ